MPFRARILRTAVVPATLLALSCAPGRALALSADCPALFDLYRACYDQGARVDTSRACMEDSADSMARALAKTARKSPQTARALVELVCGTGCDDALTRQPQANRQEFGEAFCE